MRDKFAKIPAPLGGLGLGLASLGSVTGNFNSIIGNILGGIAALVLLLFLGKIIFNFSAFKQDLKHPVFSSIVPTFSMGLMIIATFLGKLNYTTGRALWLAAIIIHSLLLISFLINTFKNFNFENVVPSYFIPPVGIVVACISGKMFNLPELCHGLFYFGFFSYMIFLVMVLVRLGKGELPIPKKATLAILAAPASLCLAGYLSLSSVPHFGFLYVLVPLSVIMTFSVYFLLFKLLKIPFNPGYSAYTFPLVISAVAMLKLAGYLTKNSISWGFYVKQLAMIELYIATFMVIFVSLKYLELYFLPNKKSA